MLVGFATMSVVVVFTLMPHMRQKMAPAAPAMASVTATPNLDIVHPNFKGNAVIIGSGDPGSPTSTRSSGHEIENTLVNRQALRVSDIVGQCSVLMMVVGRVTNAATQRLVLESNERKSAFQIFELPLGDSATKSSRSQTVSPRAAAQSYAGNELIGGAYTGRKGEWTLILSRSVADGMHRPRRNRITRRGKAVTKVKRPLGRPNEVTATLGVSPVGDKTLREYVEGHTIKRQISLNKKEVISSVIDNQLSLMLTTPLTGPDLIRFKQ
jgi:hypothetical protein